MVCNICLKNTATIHVQEMMNDNKNEGHYCSDCAAKKGVKLHTFGKNGVAKCVFSFSSANNKKIPEKVDKSPSSVCSECNMTSDEFQKSGRLGCEACYEAFSELLNDMLSEFHRGKFHRGKMPISSNKKKMNNAIHNRQSTEVTNSQSETQAILYQKLKKAIAIEDFELAAFLRDQLSPLEKNPTTFSLPGESNAIKKTN